MEKPLRLDMATINKDKPSYARVKVQVDLLSQLPDRVEIEVINISTKESRIECIKIQYDILSKKCVTCKLQGHNEEECKNLHPKLRKKKDHEFKEDGEAGQHKEKNRTRSINKGEMGNKEVWNPTNRRFQDGEKFKQVS